MPATDFRPVTVRELRKARGAQRRAEAESRRRHRAEARHEKVVAERAEAEARLVAQAPERAARAVRVRAVARALPLPWPVIDPYFTADDLRGAALTRWLLRTLRSGRAAQLLTRDADDLYCERDDWLTFRRPPGTGDTRP